MVKEMLFNERRENAVAQIQSFRQYQENIWKTT